MNSTSQSTHGVGDLMPDLTLPSLDGGIINLRDFRGRKYILFMWASW